MKNKDPHAWVCHVWVNLDIVRPAEVNFHITTQPRNNTRKRLNGQEANNHISIMQVIKKFLEIRDEPTMNNRKKIREDLRKITLIFSTKTLGINEFDQTYNQVIVR